jgi:hypothetical protein
MTASQGMSQGHRTSVKGGKADVRVPCRKCRSAIPQALWGAKFCWRRYFCGSSLVYESFPFRRLRFHDLKLLRHARILLSGGTRWARSSGSAGTVKARANSLSKSERDRIAASLIDAAFSLASFERHRSRAAERSSSLARSASNTSSQPKWRACRMTLSPPATGSIATTGTPFFRARTMP